MPGSEVYIQGMPRLSKSRIMSSLQCLKRAHPETNRKELAHYSKQTEAAFALGHEVGDTAIRLYGQDAMFPDLADALQAIHPSTADERREEIREELLKYCKHDTLTMVCLVEFFASQPESAQ